MVSGTTRRYRVSGRARHQAVPKQAPARRGCRCGASERARGGTKAEPKSAANADATLVMNVMYSSTRMECGKRSDTEVGSSDHLTPQRSGRVHSTEGERVGCPHGKRLGGTSIFAATSKQINDPRSVARACTLLTRMSAPSSGPDSLRKGRDSPWWNVVVAFMCAGGGTFV